MGPNDVKTVLEESAQLIAVADALLTGSASKPPPKTILKALLAIEKTAQPQTNHNFAPFIGTWRLCFVTLKGKPHQQAGQTMGRGLYIPPWVTLQIVYTSAHPSEHGILDVDRVGQIANQVYWGGLGLSLTGPARCQPKKNIMAFNFTRITVTAWGKTLHQGFIRGGQTSEQSFWSDSLRNQAFFVYFLIHERITAARGRGGGLALWAKTSA